jgi:tetratricopeptide (TPR) repeat protein
LALFRFAFCVVCNDRTSQLLAPLADRLMRFHWFTKQCRIFAGGFWLVATASLLDAATPFQPAPPSAPSQTVTPLLIENPHLKRQPVGKATPKHPSTPQSSSSVSAQPNTRTSIPVVGAVVEPETPVPYRLPGVSSFAPTPVDAATIDAPQFVLPPQPPGGTMTDPSESPPADEDGVNDIAGLANENSTVPQPATRGIGQSFERSLLQRDVSANDLPLPQATEVKSPHASLPESKPRMNGPDESIGPGTPPYAPTTVELTSQLLPAVQRGYDLAQRGALFAAQTEFVQVLRRIAQAKDVVSHSDKHSRALAAGLRALDEAEDFVPKGVQLEAELDLETVTSSHRTPVLRDCPQELLPHQAAVLYLNFAQSQLAHAAAGEQAGSMALHGLGKIYARLAERNDDDLQYGQRAAAMYSAALAARPDNHLAANELGVLLCRCGRAAESVPLFQQAIDAAPCALAYHNLAMAQRKMGLDGQAAANEQESQRLAAWERTTGALSRRAGVQWVTPAQLSRVAQPAPLGPGSYNAATPDLSAPVQRAASLEPAEKSTWQKVADFGRSLPLPSLDSTKNIRNAHPETRIARPNPEQPAPGQTQWR